MTSVTKREAKNRIAKGLAVYANYFDRKTGQQRKARVFQMTDHGDEITIEHGPGDRTRIAYNSLQLTTA